MATFLLGMNAKIYYGEAEAELSTLTEMTNVRDVTLTLEAGEADVTTRANKGWRSTAPTLRECTVEFEMLWIQSDAGFQAVKTAFLAATLVRLAVLTGESDAAGTEGPVGDFCVTKFDRNEPLDGEVEVDVTLKLAKFTAWNKTS